MVLDVTRVSRSRDLQTTSELNHDSTNTNYLILIVKAILEQLFLHLRFIVISNDYDIFFIIDKICYVIRTDEIDF